MFGTLSFNAEKGSAVFQSRTYSPEHRGQGSRRFACDLCRTQKVKCSGGSGGGSGQGACTRCKDLKVRCIFTSTSAVTAATINGQMSNASRGRRKSLQSRPTSSRTSSTHDGDFDFNILETSPPTTTSLSESEGPTVPPSASASTPNESDVHHHESHINLDELSENLFHSANSLLVDDNSHFATMDWSLDTNISSCDFSPNASDSLDFSLHNTGRCSPDLAAGVISPDLVSTDTLSGTRSLASAHGSSSSNLNVCDCLRRLSSSLFHLNGDNLRTDSVRLDLNLQGILSAQTSLTQISAVVQNCPQCCASRVESCMLFLMCVQRLVALYSGLVDDGSRSPIVVGDYVVQDPVERQNIVSLVVAARAQQLKTCVTSHSRLLASVPNARDCDLRIAAVLQSLDALMASVVKVS